MSSHPWHGVEELILWLGTSPVHRAVGSALVLNVYFSTLLISMSTFWIPDTPHCANKQCRQAEDKGAVDKIGPMPPEA